MPLIPCRRIELRVTAFTDTRSRPAGGSSFPVATSSSLGGVSLPRASLALTQT